MNTLLEILKKICLADKNEVQDENIFEEKTRFDFKSLTPKSDVDLAVYSQALLFTLSNKDIRNVAITGSYGAGKSSVMETFKRTEEGRKHTYLHVSLAQFERTTEKRDDNKTEEEKKEEGSRTSLERQLEGKIINQLIHKIPEENILDSKVQVRKRIDEDKVTIWTIGIILGLIVTVYLSLYVTMTKVETNNGFLLSICRILTKPEIFWAVVLIGFGLLFGLVRNLVMAQMKNKFFKKVCIKNSEIELFGEENAQDISYFDKYLDEIKYLIINANIDVFVFEDIDRYETNLIFEKLREINNIVNENRDKPIRFFYLVRDDLFVQKDRTKFFDFIIPVIPVISGHNSFNIFFKYMGKNGGELSRQFLKQISLYIDDMRILNNIYNEYQIYRDKFKEICVDKSAEKLFALVTYKNIFPQDFIKLQNREGYIADVFEALKADKKSKIDEKRKQIESLQNTIKAKLEVESTIIAKDLKEIDALYIGLDEEYSCKDKKKHEYENYAEFVADLIQNPEKVKYKSGAYWYPGETKIKSLIEKMKTNPDYQNRVGQINRKKDYLSKDINQIRQEIIDLEKQIDEISNQNLAPYMKMHGEIKLTYNKEKKTLSKKEEYIKSIRQSPYIKLIEFLLKDGYIDENYGDFMAMFHNSDISQSDKKFVRAILENRPLGYYYKVEDPRIVDEYLKVHNLECEAAINYDMFRFYMTNKDEERKEAIGKALNTYEPIDFIINLLEDKNLEYELWIKYLKGVTESVLRRLDLHRGAGEGVVDVFCALLLINVLGYEISDYDDEYKDYIKKEVCRDASMFEYVLNHDFCEVDRELKLQHLINNLSYLEWQLPYFDFDIETSRDIAEIIYENDFYEINVPMIKQILTKWYNIEVEDDETHLYDKIASTNELEKDRLSHLYTYVNENVNLFIDVIITSLKAINDSPERLLELLRGADNEHKNKLLSNMNAIFEDISIIDNIEMLNKIIKHKKLAYKPEYIFKYYDLYMEAKREIDELGEDFTSEDLFIKYINDFPADKFSFTKAEMKIYREKEVEDRRKIINKINQSEELDNDKYHDLVKVLKFEYVTQAPALLTLEKIGILIEEKIIKMTKDVLPGMRERYPSMMKEFILQNIDTYVGEVIDDTNFSLAECKMLLEEDIPDDYKTKLLLYTNAEISVQGKNLSEAVLLNIVTHNFDIKDFEYIIKQDYESEDLQSRVNKIAEKGVDDILENDYQMSKKVCKYLVSWQNTGLEENEKKQILAHNMELFSIEELCEIMEELNMEDFIQIFSNKKPLIEITEINTQILSAMQSCGYVGSFKEDKIDVGKYRVYPRRIKTGAS